MDQQLAFTRRLRGITLPPRAQARSSSGPFRPSWEQSVLFLPLQALPSTSEQCHVSTVDMAWTRRGHGGAPSDALRDVLPAFQLLVLSACRAVAVPLQPLLVITRPLPVCLSHIRIFSWFRAPYPVRSHLDQHSLQRPYFQIRSRSMFWVNIPFRGHSPSCPKERGGH